MSNESVFYKTVKEVTVEKTPKKQLDEKKKIVFFYSNRSEIGLIEPVAKALEAKGFNAILDNLAEHMSSMAYFGDIYEYVYHSLADNKPELVFTPFDRPETIFATIAAFYLNIPIAQMHAGDISQGTFDDVTRHVISLYASYHFCNGMASTERVKRLLESVGKPSTFVFDVGSTAFDDVDVEILDESIVPKEPYALIVYNVPTKQPQLIRSELTQIEYLIEQHSLSYKSIWIKPSAKENVDAILSTIEKLEERGIVKSYTSLPRLQFLALMKHCRYFIGNSSSILYEAPAFLKPEQIIHVGVRNRGREPIEIKAGGSQRIADIITFQFNPPKKG